ncbi:MAG: hypothetical protein ACOYM3_22330, partial [Terrimicrobiaceae bacterium]
QMAKNAQVASIGVTCGVHLAHVLQQYQPLFCLEQTTGLLEKLEANPLGRVGRTQPVTPCGGGQRV